MFASAGSRMATSRSRSASPAKRNVTSAPKKTVNTPSAPVRPPFISTSNQKPIFGPPPALPPRPPSPEKQSQSASVILEAENRADSISLSTTLLLQKQTVRWINLSRTFWGLIVMDSHRTVDKESLSSFHQVMDWRRHDNITEEEFTHLFSEWMSKNEPISRRKSTMGIFAVRQLLLEKNCCESDLDLLIGMIMHETNKSMIGTPLSYLHRSYQQNNPSLEVCTDEWLHLSEELFFLLDTSGYGILRFDEMFFFSACLVIGFEGWATEAQLETSLSLHSITAMTLQIMRDAGASILVSSLQVLPLKSSLISKSQSTKASVSPSGKFSISVPMFKAYLLKKGLGKIALANLISHTQECLTRVMYMCRTHAPDLFQCFFPIEKPQDGDSAGPPRLWQVNSWT